MRKVAIFVSVFVISLAWFCSPSLAQGRKAEEILGEINKLSSAERQKRLEEGSTRKVIAPGSALTRGNKKRLS